MWKTIKSYIWWTHERGSLHYDVMVTLILAFIFVGPRFIDFRDKPPSRTPHQSGVVEISADGHGGLIATVDAKAIDEGAAPEPVMRRMIEPISGDVTIEKVETVRDGRGKIVSYRAFVKRN